MGKKKKVFRDESPETVPTVSRGITVLQEYTTASWARYKWVIKHSVHG